MNDGYRMTEYFAKKGFTAMPLAEMSLPDEPQYQFGFRVNVTQDFMTKGLPQLKSLITEIQTGKAPSYAELIPNTSELYTAKQVAPSPKR